MNVTKETIANIIYYPNYFYSGDRRLFQSYVATVNIVNNYSRGNLRIENLSIELSFPLLDDKLISCLVINSYNVVGNITENIEDRVWLTAKIPKQYLPINHIVKQDQFHVHYSSRQYEFHIPVINIPNGYSLVICIGALEANQVVVTYKYDQPIQ